MICPPSLGGIDDEALSSIFERLFVVYDPGNHGAISFTRFVEAQQAVASCLGDAEAAEALETQPEDFRAMFFAADLDANGEISQEEFVKWQLQLARSSRRARQSLREGLTRLVVELEAGLQAEELPELEMARGGTGNARKPSLPTFGRKPPSNGLGNSSVPMAEHRKPSLPPLPKAAAPKAAPRAAAKAAAGSAVRGRSPSAGPAVRPASPSARVALPTAGGRRVSRGSSQPPPSSHRAPSPDVGGRPSAIGGSGVRSSSGGRTSPPVPVEKAVGSKADPREFAWRNRTVIGTFLDPYIEDTNLEGGRLAETLGEVADALVALAAPGSALVGGAKESVKEVAKLFSEARTMGLEAASSFKENQGERWASSLRERLLGLKPSELLVQEGGWRGDHGAHAILYVFEKASDEVYYFTIVNTGAGVRMWHPGTTASLLEGKMKHRTAMRVPVLQERVTAPEFLFHLFRMKHVQHRFHRGDQLYRVLLPWALPPGAHGDPALAALAGEASNGELATVQRSGTCFFKCVAHALRFLLKHQGLSPGGCKTVMFELRRLLFGRIASDLKQAVALRSLDPSEHRAVECATRQIARKALREHKAGRLNEDQLDEVHKQVKRVEGFLKPPAEAAHVEGETFSTEATWQPFTGFGLLADSLVGLEDGARAELGGPAVVAQPSPFVDVARAQERLTALASEQARGGDVGQLLEALKAVLTVADELEGSTCDMTGKRHIMALLEGLLAGGTGSPLLRRGLAPKATAEQQQALLAAWEVASRHYLAAALSVPTGQVGYGRRVVAYASLLEQMDLAVRLESGGPGKLFEEARRASRPLWPAGALPICSGQLSSDVSRSVGFGNVTATLPLTSLAWLERRGQVAQHFQDQSALTLCTSGSGPRAEIVFKNTDNFPGLDVVRLCAGLVAAARGSGALGISEEPLALLTSKLNRAPKDFELGALWAFDRKLDQACPEWKQCRDTFLRYHLLLAMTQPGDAAGRDAPAWRSGGATVRCSEVNLRFHPAFYDTVAGFPDTMMMQLVLGDGAEPCRLCAGPCLSRCDPGRLGGGHVLPRSGSREVSEADVLTADTLPDFDHSMTQSAAEELLAILTVPSLRVPLLLRFFVPDRTSLLHDRRLQEVLLAALFEPGLLGAARTGRLAPEGEPEEVPCSPGLLGTPKGLLVYELQHSPEATLQPMVQLHAAMPELGACDFDGPFVQPFLFVLHVSVLVQGVLLRMIERASPHASEKLEEFAQHFRRFNQAYTRSRLLRWLEQALARSNYAAAAKLHAHLCLTTLPLLSLEADDLQCLVSSATLFWTWYRSDRAPGVTEASEEDWTVEADAVEWVTTCLHAHRLQILEALADEERRTRVLNFALLQALGRKAAGPAAAAALTSRPALTWRAAQRELDAFVRVTNESQHPYAKADLTECTVQIAGAKSLTVRFNEQSDIGPHSSLEIKMKTENSAAAQVIFRKTSDNEWPGLGGVPPLVITGASQFTVRLSTIWGSQSDGNVNPSRNWGYHMTVEAPLDHCRVVELSKQFSGVPNWACAEALAHCGGDARRAAKHLAEQRGRLDEEERVRQQRAQRLGLFEAAVRGSGPEAEAVRSLVGARFNAQTGVIFFSNLGGFQPLPDDLLAARDFQPIRRLLRFAELGQPNGVIRASQVNRRVLQFKAQDATFQAELWEETTKESKYRVSRRAGAGGSWQCGSTGEVAANAPVMGKSGKTVKWCDAEWRQLEGKWWKELHKEMGGKCTALEALMSEPKSIEGERESPPPTWLQMPGCSWAAKLGDTLCFVSLAWRGRALLVDKRNDSMVELQVRPGGRLIAFALEEVARAVHRRAVWVSDAWAAPCYMDPDTFRCPLREYPPALERFAGSCSQLPGSADSLRLVRDQEVHVPARLLEGLLPRALLGQPESFGMPALKPPPFHFWQGPSGLRGEPRDSQCPWFPYVLHVEFLQAGGPQGSPLDGAAIWREEPGGERWWLLNTEEAAASGCLRPLCSVLSDMEPLGYTLLWASRAPGASGELPAKGEALRLRLVELPRLRLRFEPEEAAEGGAWLLSREHAGFFLSPSPCPESACPHALPPERGTLRSRAGETRLLAPIGPVWRPEVYESPFGTRLFLRRASEAGGSSFKQALVTYELRFLQVDVHSASSLAALWLCVTRLLRRDYLGAAQLLTLCTADHRPVHDELHVWRTGADAARDRAPDAAALRLRLLLLASQWGGLGTDVDKAAVFAAWGEYLTKLTHVSAECRLRWREELVLSAFLETARYEDEELDALVRNRGRVLQGLQSASEGGDDKEISLEAGWASAGAWWADVPVEQLPEEDKVKAWRADTVSVAVVARSTRHADFLVGHCKEKWTTGPWATLYDILCGAGPASEGQAGPAQRRLAELALREYFVHVAKDASGVSLDYAVALCLALLWRDTEGPDAVGPGDWPPYKRIKDTEVLNIMRVDADARLAFFQDLVAAAHRSLAREPWRPFGEASLMPTFRQKERGEDLKLGADDLPFELPRTPAGFQCQWRPLSGQGSAGPLASTELSAKEAEELAAGRPLALALEDLGGLAVEAQRAAAAWQASSKAPPTGPALQGSLGVEREVLARMRQSCEDFAASMREPQCQPELAFLTHAQLQRGPSQKEVDKAEQQLASLMDELKMKQASFAKRANASLAKVLEALNAHGGTEDALARSAALRSPARWLWALLAAMDDEVAVLRRLGLATSQASAVAHSVLGVLALAAAAQQARRARQLGLRLQRALAPLGGPKAGREELRTAESAAEALAGELLARRTCGSRREPDGWGVDPRFLAFEWLFGKGLLRSEQLEMIQGFVEAAKAGRSKVQQLLMGGGKTHVIGPLLQVLLCSQGSLVVQVVPEALFGQTLRVTRGLLSQSLAVPVFGFDFSRRMARNEEEVVRRRRRLEEASEECAVLCSTGSSVKAVLLTFVDAIAGERVESERDAVAAAELQRMLRVLRGATAILDEIDMLLHPLKSEMNFPVGLAGDIDLCPERWELPLHLLEPFCLRMSAPASLAPSLAQGDAGGRVKAVFASLRQAIAEGNRTMALQLEPHAMLLSQDFYAKRLRPLLCEWLAAWLARQPALARLQEEQLVGLLRDRDRPVSCCTDKQGRQLLILGREWLFSMLPHCLRKVHRVQYGVLLDSDVERFRRHGVACAGTRLQLAVPFVGKDRPSPAAEFSHPEVLVGLTILACAHGGMRPWDVRRAVLRLKEHMLRETMGHVRRRPSWRQFQRWLRASEVQLSASSGAPPPAVPPLHLVHPEGSQLEALHKRLAQLPECQHFFLSQIVFPSATRTQHAKLSATAAELGGRGLFRVRLGFSGTPGGSLPLALGRDTATPGSPVDFAPGCEGRVLATLTAKEVVSICRVDKGWTVRSLLRLVATRGYHALIDTGAVITGLTNAQVARLLLDEGLVGLEGIVFFAHDDTEMVLTREEARAVPLAECALAPHQRFTFYDNAHTTGIDIEQGYLATAALTLSKDTTFRDAQQGAWRMRRLGSGQRLEILVLQELASVVRDSMGDQSLVPANDEQRALRDLVAFLVRNQLDAEVLAASQLAAQDVRSAWKAHAISELVDRLDVSPALKENCWPLPHAAVQAVRALIEPLSFLVPDKLEEAAEGTGGTTARLQRLAQELSAKHGPAGMSEAQEGIARAAELLAKAPAATAPPRPAVLSRCLSSSEGHDSEVVRESEQEQEKQVEIEKHDELKLCRGHLGMPTAWQLSELVSGAVNRTWNTLAHAVNQQMKVKAFAEAWKSVDVEVRWSPNVCPKEQSGSAAGGIFRPALLALHVQRASSSVAYALSLAEAAAVRRAMEQGCFDTCSAHLQLRARGPVGTSAGGRGAGGLTLAKVGENPGEKETAKVASQQALLRFFHGDVWLTEAEVDMLSALVAASGRSGRGAWLQAWKACEAWRRPGGIQRWDLTPLGKILGDGACAAQLREEELVQAAALAAASAAGAGGLEDVLDWLGSCLGGKKDAVACRRALSCLEGEEGWPLLVGRLCDEDQKVELLALAEEVASRVGSGDAVRAQCALQRETTVRLLGGTDFIAAAQRIAGSPEG